MAKLNLVTQAQYPKIMEYYYDIATNAWVATTEQAWGLSLQETARAFWSTKYGAVNLPQPGTYRKAVGVLMRWNTASGDLQFNDAAIDPRSGLPMIGIGGANTIDGRPPVVIIDGKWDISGSWPATFACTPRFAEFPKFVFLLSVTNGTMTLL